MSEPILKVEHLVKVYPVRGSRDVISAVNDVSFEIGVGETLGLVGESGSGKTTVGRCALRLVDPTNGNVSFRTESLLKMTAGQVRAFRRRAQLVFQESNDAMDPRRRVHEVVREPLDLHSIGTKSSRARRVVELLEMAGLSAALLDRWPHQLSAGQQQRVGIARVLGLEPQLIVLDEPTSNLDPESSASIIDLLRSLQERLGLSYLFISHDLEVIRALCHRVAVMYLGRIVEIGTVDEVFNFPHHPYTAALLSAALPADPTIGRSDFVLQGEIPSPIRLPQGCFFYSRCPIAKATCTNAFPPLNPIRAQHNVACYFPEEGARLRTRPMLSPVSDRSEEAQLPGPGSRSRQGDSP